MADSSDHCTFAQSISHKNPGLHNVSLYGRRWCISIQQYPHASLTVPRIIHHTQYSSIGAWYIWMEKIPGVSLDKVIDTLTVEQLGHIASQLKSILARLHCRVFENTRIRFRGTLSQWVFPTTCVAQKHAFSSVGEFLDHYREMLMLFYTEQYTESLLSRIPRNAAMVTYFPRISWWKGLTLRVL